VSMNKEWQTEMELVFSQANDIACGIDSLKGKLSISTYLVSQLRDQLFSKDIEIESLKTDATKQEQGINENIDELDIAVSYMNEALVVAEEYLDQMKVETQSKEDEISQLSAKNVEIEWLLNQSCDKNVEFEVTTKSLAKKIAALQCEHIDQIIANGKEHASELASLKAEIQNLMKEADETEETTNRNIDDIEMIIASVGKEVTFLWCHLDSQNGESAQDSTLEITEESLECLPMSFHG
jgi:chromosome segregation ATPase